MELGAPGDIHRGMCLVIFSALHGERNPLAEAIGEAVTLAQQKADPMSVDGLRELEASLTRASLTRARFASAAIDAAWPLVLAALDRDGLALLDTEYRATRTVLAYMAAQEGRDGEDGRRSLALLESAGAILPELPPSTVAVPDTPAEPAEPAEGAAAHVAISILMLGDSELRDALGDALDAALTGSEQVLEGASTTEHHKRRSELLELAAALGEGPLVPCEHDHRAAWRLLLSHLSQRQQERLEAELGRALSNLEQSAAEEEPGSQMAADTLELFSEAQQLVSELPYATIAAPGPGRDDHDDRRRTLRVEVERSQDPVRDPTPVRAAWRDGYQTLIAQMFVEMGQDCAWWRLEIEDPAPGREVRRDLPDGTRGASLYSDSFRC
jgi:hypothetical protein